MHEVIPNSLRLGHTGDARDATRLVDAGIAAVVDLALEDSPPRLPREMTYCRFPLIRRIVSIQQRDQGAGIRERHGRSGRRRASRLSRNLRALSCESAAPPGTCSLLCNTPRWAPR